MTQPRDKSKHPHQVQSGLTQSANAADHRLAVAEQVTQALTHPLPPVPARSLTDDQLDWALERLRCGDYMLNVTEELGVSRSYLYRRGELDPTFDDRLDRAIGIGVHARLERVELGLDGVEGYTTGNVSRDAARAEFAKWRGRALNRRKYNVDKPIFGAANITVQLNGPTDDFA